MNKEELKKEIKRLKSRLEATRKPLSADVTFEFVDGEYVMEDLVNVPLQLEIERLEMDLKRLEDDINVKY